MNYNESSSVIKFKDELFDMEDFISIYNINLVCSVILTKKHQSRFFVVVVVVPYCKDTRCVRQPSSFFRAFFLSSCQYFSIIPLPDFRAFLSVTTFLILFLSSFLSVKTKLACNFFLPTPELSLRMEPPIWIPRIYRRTIRVINFLFFILHFLSKVFLSFLILYIDFVFSKQIL